MTLSSSWGIVGTFILCLMTWQDFRNNMMIDDRRNWLMYGFTFSLFIISIYPFWIKLVVLVIFYYIRYIMSKNRAIGEADVNALYWSFMGFFLLNPWYLLFFTVLISFALILNVLGKKMLKVNKPTPMLHLVAICFITTCALTGLYII